MDERVLDVIGEVQSFMADKNDAWSLPAEAAAFVHGTVLACGAKRCVEIGTSYGHSGLWIGAAVAVNGGTLLTIDTERRKSDIAAGYFRKAGLDRFVCCRTGAAADILADLTGPIDWALNDADKENCRTYVDLLYPKLPVGGVVLTDNATSHDEVREQFLPWIRGDDRFVSGLVDVGNGIEFSIKVK